MGDKPRICQSNYIKRFSFLYNLNILYLFILYLIILYLIIYPAVFCNRVRKTY